MPVINASRLALMASALPMVILSPTVALAPWHVAQHPREPRQLIAVTEEPRTASTPALASVSYSLPRTSRVRPGRLLVNDDQRSGELVSVSSMLGPPPTEIPVRLKTATNQRHRWRGCW